MQLVVNLFNKTNYFQLSERMKLKMLGKIVCDDPNYFVYYYGFPDSDLIIYRVSLFVILQLSDVSQKCTNWFPFIDNHI